MKHQLAHISDADLLLHLEGELPSTNAKRIGDHVASCWKCRTRRQDLETAITDFVRVYQREMDLKLPPAAGPRALLKARLSQMASAQTDKQMQAARGRTLKNIRVFAVPVVALGVLLLTPYFLGRNRSPKPITGVVSLPDSRLTPGAALLVSRSDVCAQMSTNNKSVSVAVQREVLREYGMIRADPKAYEIDYLVTPALGGADDIHNLWPHSYSSTAWNAQVKDALENRLRQMVCDGKLDLSEAQREIAGNWIAAYKKYFHTDSPIEER